MPFYQYDDRDKDREGLDNAIEAFLTNGGNITAVPNERKIAKLRRSKAASQRSEKKNGEETVFDFGEF